MALFVNFNEMQWWTPTGLDKVYMKRIAGERVMMGLVEAEPEGSGHPLHQHEEEQISYVLQGRLEVTVRDTQGERTQVLESGMAYIVEPMAFHGTRIIGDEKVIVMEIWSPPAQRHLEGALRLKAR